jgi:cytochrome c
MRSPALALLLAPALLAGCGDVRLGGDRAEGQSGTLVERSAERGARVIAETGCGSCHTIPGIRGAQGKVAPPLDFFSRRAFIAGQLPNTYDNLVRWLKSPPSVEPGTAMPVVGLTDAQARDAAAYLETLR